MDYRSDEAKHINSLFMNARLANIYEMIGGRQTIVGYKHRSMDLMYLRTTKDRLVRVDGPAYDYQYNLLSKDRQRFEPMDRAFARGESIDRTRPFLRSDLIPPQSMYEFGRDVIMPRAIWLVAGAALAAGVQPILHFITAHTMQTGVVGAVGATQAAAFGVRVHHDAHEHNDVDTPHHTDDHTAHETHAEHVHHAVPGSVEHAAEAPNGCVLDGTPESAGAAMLPGPCSSKVTWVAFDVHDEHGVSGAHTPISHSSDEPAPFTSVDYTGRVTHGVHHPMTMAEKVALGAGVGIIGAAQFVAARDMTTNDYRQIQRDVNRRLDAEQAPHNRSGFGMPPIQR